MRNKRLIAEPKEGAVQNASQDWIERTIGNNANKDRSKV
jgi:hypothetical protein